MQNFECIGGPFAGSRLPCKFKPYEGAREVVYLLDGEMEREAFYELRRHTTVELITGEGVWQWHYVEPADASFSRGPSGPAAGSDS